MSTPFRPSAFSTPDRTRTYNSTTPPQAMPRVPSPGTPSGPPERLLDAFVASKYPSQKSSLQASPSSPNQENQTVNHPLLSILLARWIGDVEISLHSMLMTRIAASEFHGITTPSHRHFLNGVRLSPSIRIIATANSNPQLDRITSSPHLNPATQLVLLNCGLCKHNFKKIGELITEFKSLIPESTNHLNANSCTTSNHSSESINHIAVLEKITIENITSDLINNTIAALKKWHAKEYLGDHFLQLDQMSNVAALSFANNSIEYVLLQLENSYDLTTKGIAELLRSKTRAHGATLQEQVKNLLDIIVVIKQRFTNDISQTEGIQEGLDYIIGQLHILQDCLSFLNKHLGDNFDITLRFERVHAFLKHYFKEATPPDFIATTYICLDPTRQKHDLNDANAFITTNMITSFLANLNSTLLLTASEQPSPNSTSPQRILKLFTSFFPSSHQEPSNTEHPTKLHTLLPAICLSKDIDSLSKIAHDDVDVKAQCNYINSIRAISALIILAQKLNVSLDAFANIPTFNNILKTIADNLAATPESPFVNWFVKSLTFTDESDPTYLLHPQLKIHTYDNALIISKEGTPINADGSSIAPIIPSIILYNSDHYAQGYTSIVIVKGADLQSRSEDNDETSDNNPQVVSLSLRNQSVTIFTGTADLSIPGPDTIQMVTCRPSSGLAISRTDNTLTKIVVANQ